MNRRQKQFASVLGVAVVALGIDRFVLGPGEASASSPDGAVTGAETGDVGPTVVSAAPTPSLEASVAGRLEAVARDRSLSAASVLDAFEMPAKWTVEPRTVQVRSGSPRFEDTHQLQAALANGADSLAIVNGETVRLGEMISGMRLVSVQDRAAVFASREGTLVSLPLAE